MGSPSLTKAARAGALISLLPVLFSCATVPQTLNPALFYKRDMMLSLDGNTGEGVLVAGAAVAGVRKNFSVTAKAPMTLYTFITCHREVAFSNLPQTVASYFTPVAGLEDQPGCGLSFNGLDEKEGQHSWGYVDFQDPQTVLPHVVKCNGETWNSAGVTVCQSRQGNVQRIEFPVPVVVAAEPQCPKLDAADRQNFEFPLPHGKCIYRFEEISGKRQARVTTFGYESILIRKD